MSDRPLVIEVFPDLAVELRLGLRADGLEDLAGQVDELRVHAICPCQDSFCTSFYTDPPPDGAYGPGHENIVPTVKEGMVVLDVVDRKIKFVEVIDRTRMRPSFEALRTRLSES